MRFMAKLLVWHVTDCENQNRASEALNKTASYKKTGIESSFFGVSSNVRGKDHPPPQVPTSHWAVILPSQHGKFKTICEPFNLHLASISVLYRYFHRNSLARPRQTFTVRMRHATYIIANHPYSIGEKLHLSSFFPRTTALRNRLPTGCFLDHYNFNLFKARVNNYLPPLCTQNGLQR